MPDVRRSAPTPRARIDSPRILRLAERQWGVVSRSQLEDCGLSGSTISRWVAAGRLQRLYPRVYAVGHRALSLEGRLLGALLYAGPGAALSHATAASWWGLLSTELRTIDVCAARRRRSRPGVRVHRPRRFERVLHRRLPVTAVSRTLLDLATSATPRVLRRAVAVADYCRLIDAPEVHEALRSGHQGAAPLRAALEAYSPRLARTLSELEERFLELCTVGEIPPPEVNRTVCGLMVDALWRRQRVIVELDGRAAHATGRAMERDRDRDLKLRAAGFEVLRYTWRQVTKRGEEVVADLDAALARRPDSE